MADVDPSSPRRIVAALHWPGYAESGEPDIAARIAEYGADFGSCDVNDGSCDEWEFQREVPVQDLTGAVRVHRYEGRGHIQPPRWVRRG